MSDQPQETSSGNKQSSGASRDPQPSEKIRRPTLAPTGSLEANDVATQRAMRLRITQDLPRMNRSFDPNRIQLEVPPEFLSPGTAAEKGKSLQIERHGTSASPSHAPSQVSYGTLSSSANDIVRSPGVTAAGALSSYNFSVVPSDPMTVLGAGRITSFTNYPIQMNAGELWLIDQVNNGQDPTFRTFRDRWLPVSIGDAATFHQFLSNVSLNISRVQGENLDNAVSVAHHSLAIRAVNQKLSDPNSSLGDDIIVSILSFICYSTIREDFHGASIHLDGLDVVIRLRGGYATIENKPVLASLLHGVDMTRSMRQDTQPRFPLPKRLIQQAQKYYMSYDPSYITQALQSGPWREIFPSDHGMISIFDELCRAIEIVRLRTRRNEQWRAVSFITFQIYPAIHRLLSMGLDPDSDDRWSIVQEASRLGILLFLGEIRRQCGALGVSTRLYVTKLKAFMDGLGTKIDWTSSSLLLLWIIFFGLLESWELPEQDWYVVSVQVVMSRMGIQSWDYVVDEVKSFMWVDNIYDERIELFRSLISSGSTDF